MEEKQKPDNKFRLMSLLQPLSEKQRKQRGHILIINYSRCTMQDARCRIQDAR